MLICLDHNRHCSFVFVFLYSVWQRLTSNKCVSVFCPRNFTAFLVPFDLKVVLCAFQNKLTCIKRFNNIFPKSAKRRCKVSKGKPLPFNSHFSINKLALDPHQRARNIGYAL